MESRDPGVRQNQLIEIQSRLTELENRHVDTVSNVPSTVEVDLGPLEERISKIESLKTIDTSIPVALEARISTLESEPKVLLKVEKQLSDIANRIVELENTQVEIVEPVSVDLSPLEDRIFALENRSVESYEVSIPDDIEERLQQLERYSHPIPTGNTQKQNDERLSDLENIASDLQSALTTVSSYPDFSSIEKSYFCS